MQLNKLLNIELGCLLGDYNNTQAISTEVHYPLAF